LSGITLFFIFYIIRVYVLSIEWISLEITFLEDITLNLKIYKDLFLGFLAVIVRLFVLGFWQEVLKAFSPEELLLGSSTIKDPDRLNLSTFAMDKGKNPEQVPSKEGSAGSARGTIKGNPEQVPGKEGSVLGSGSTVKEDFDPIIVEILGDRVKEDTKEVNKAMLAWAGRLKSYRDLPLDQMRFTPESEEPLLTLLRTQSNIYTQCVKNRMTWVNGRSINTLEENQAKIKEIYFQLAEIQDNYLSKVDRISKLENRTTQVKEFYATLNEYRRLSLKELNKADNIILEDIRKSALNKHRELKKVINSEYTEAKKEFNSQDGYLKMKVGEIINARKN